MQSRALSLPPLAQPGLAPPASSDAVLNVKWAAPGAGDRNKVEVPCARGVAVQLESSAAAAGVSKETGEAMGVMVDDAIIFTLERVD